MSFKYVDPEVRKATERRDRRIRAILNHGLENKFISSSDVDRFYQLWDDERDFYMSGDEEKSWKCHQEGSKILDRCDPDHTVHNEQMKLEHAEAEKEHAAFESKVRKYAREKKIDLDMAYQVLLLQKLEENLRAQNPDLPDDEELAEIIREKELLPKFIEGTDPGPYYALTAVDIHLPIRNELQDVKKRGRAFSVNDDHFIAFLDDIFTEEFNAKLPANRQRYTSWEKPDTKRFDYYANSNFYTREDMIRIADRIKERGLCFRNNDIKSLPEKQSLRMQRYELENTGLHFLQMQKYRLQTAEFFFQFSERINTMIRENSKSEYFSLEGL